MKKAIIYGMSLALVLSLTACGGSNDNAADNSQDISTPEITQPVDTSTPEVEQTVEGDGLLAEDTDTTTGTESTSHSDIELYELIYESAAAMDPDFTDEMAFDMEKSLAEAYSGASASGEAFYDGYIAWRLENHPLQTTDPAPDTTPSNGGTSNGNTSGGNTSGSSGGTTSGGNTSTPSGGNTSGGGSSSSTAPGVIITAPGEGPGEETAGKNPYEGWTEEEIREEMDRHQQEVADSGITFGTGSRSN